MKRGGRLKHKSDRVRKEREYMPGEYRPPPKKKKPKAKPKKRINSPYGTKKGKRLQGREIDIANAQAFHQEARRQRVCAVCGRGEWIRVEGRKIHNPFEAHHVIEKSYLKRNFMPLFCTENSLRVCTEPCHGQHTRRNKKIPLSALLDRNVTYAFYLLGAKAYDYLMRNYEGTDERVERALAELGESTDG